MRCRTKRSAAPDLLLVVDRDPQSLAAMKRLSGRLGCDFVETDSIAGLREILTVQQPTIVVLAVDGLEGDDIAILNTLAQLTDRPPTLLIGSVHERILASAARAAESQGLRLIGTATRPLDLDAMERLLASHLSSAPPIELCELEQALTQFEMTLQYQPKVTIRGDNRSIDAVEALVRWHHPRRGVLHPRYFLDAVEEHALMTRLTDYVMTEAVRQAGQWRERGLFPAMTVNLSPRLVRDRGFPDRLGTLLQENGVPASQFVFDITEAANAEDRDLILEVFTRLRISGVGLCLDNFGTGLASLTDLYRTPFSEIKVDRSLIVDVTREPEAQIIARAIVDLAHALQLTVCAAGVETRQAYEFVRSAGFDTAQGQFFSPPVDSAEVERLIKSWPSANPLSTGKWRIANSGESGRALVPDAALKFLQPLSDTPS